MDSSRPPATIAQTLRAARDRYDIELPLADLFTWGTDEVRGIEADVRIPRAARTYRRQGVRPLRVPPGECGLADLDRRGQHRATVQAGDHQHRRQQPAANTPRCCGEFPNALAEDVFAFKPPSAGANKIVIVDMAPPQAQAKGAAK
jgi:hypothetical protein